MSYQYDYSIFIGKFQPFHKGHLRVCNLALQISKNLIVMIGSQNMAPNINHPFPFLYRQKLIQDVIKNDAKINVDRVMTVGLRDYFYSAGDSLWISQIQNILSKIIEPGKKICIVGYEKDESSYYIQVLKRVLNIDFVPINSQINVSASQIRDAWFVGYEKENRSFIQEAVPPTTYDFLYGERNFIYLNREEFGRLRKEWETVQEGKKKYPGTSVTADAIVTCAGHVLLGERGGTVGNGQIAFPGGFVDDQDVHLFDTCIRELKEECRLKVAEPILRGSLVNSKVYSHKFRDVRGRVITEAFHIDLKMDPNKGLPPIKADSDLRKVFWKPIYWLKQNPTKVFADHWEIFENLVGF